MSVRQPVAVGRGDDELGAAEAAGQRQRGRDVVAVADEGDADAVERALLLTHREQVGQRLAGVLVVREGVDDGHVGGGGEVDAATAGRRCARRCRRRSG